MQSHCSRKVGIFCWSQLETCKTLEAEDEAYTLDFVSSEPSEMINSDPGKCTPKVYNLMQAKR